MAAVMRARALPALLALLAIALAGCESPQPRLEPAKPAPPLVLAPVVAPPAPPAPLEPDRPGLTLQDYQKEIAATILRTSTGDTFQGKLPPLLRSVVVLQVSIDRHGMPEKVTLFRSNGFVDLEKLAITAVYRAAPYPIPGSSLLGGHSTLTFLESFLFRSDGRFQVRSIAEEQSTEVETTKKSKPRKAAAKKK